MKCLQQSLVHNKHYISVRIGIPVVLENTTHCLFSVTVVKDEPWFSSAQTSLQLYPPFQKKNRVEHGESTSPLRPRLDSGRSQSEAVKRGKTLGRIPSSYHPNPQCLRCRKAQGLVDPSWTISTKTMAP